MKYSHVYWNKTKQKIRKRFYLNRCTVRFYIRSNQFNECAFREQRIWFIHTSDTFIWTNEDESLTERRLNLKVYTSFKSHDGTSFCVYFSLSHIFVCFRIFSFLIWCVGNASFLLISSCIFLDGREFWATQFPYFTFLFCFAINVHKLSVFKCHRLKVLNMFKRSQTAIIVTKKVEFQDEFEFFYFLWVFRTILDFVLNLIMFCFSYFLHSSHSKIKIIMWTLLWVTEKSWSIYKFRNSYINIVPKWCNT